MVYVVVRARKRSSFNLPGKYLFTAAAVTIVRSNAYIFVWVYKSVTDTKGFFYPPSSQLYSYS